jgi:hypothetical protein
MNMVSSPEIVPATSGHSALSIATATLCAAPMVVRMTVIEGPARFSPLTNCARVPKSPFARVSSSCLRDAQVAKVATHRGLRDFVPFFLQQAHEILLPAHEAFSQDAHDCALSLDLLGIA